MEITGKKPENKGYFENVNIFLNFKNLGLALVFSA